MKHQIKLLAFLMLALLSLKSYGQSGNSIVLTPQVKQQSITFKNLSGQTRFNEYSVLDALLVTKASKSSCEGVDVADFTTRAEVYNLLGQPAAILSPNLVAYSLSASNTACQVVVGIDNDGLILFTKINKCP